MGLDIKADYDEIQKIDRFRAAWGIMRQLDSQDLVGLVMSPFHPRFGQLAKINYHKDDSCVVEVNFGNEIANVVVGPTNDNNDMRIYYRFTSREGCRLTQIKGMTISDLIMDYLSLDIAPSKLSMGMKKGLPALDSAYEALFGHQIGYSSRRV